MEKSKRHHLSFVEQLKVYEIAKLHPKKTAKEYQSILRKNGINMGDGSVRYNLSRMGIEVMKEADKPQPVAIPKLKPMGERLNERLLAVESKIANFEIKLADLLK